MLAAKLVTLGIGNVRPLLLLKMFSSKSEELTVLKMLFQRLYKASILPSSV
jgi:hypothetical protein